MICLMNSSESTIKKINFSSKRNESKRKNTIENHHQALTISLSRLPPFVLGCCGSFNDGHGTFLTPQSGRNDKSLMIDIECALMRFIVFKLTSIQTHSHSKSASHFPIPRQQFFIFSIPAPRCHLVSTNITTLFILLARS
jgi:hypothetical protein